MDIRLVVDPQAYDVCRGAVGDVPEDALAVYRHNGEQTTVVPVGHALASDAREGPWRCLTLEADLPFDVVGFFRRFADALADAGIPILPFASYRFDHVLVPEARLDDAVVAVRAEIGRD